MLADPFVIKEIIPSLSNAVVVISPASAILGLPSIVWQDMQFFLKRLRPISDAEPTVLAEVPFKPSLLLFDLSDPQDQMPNRMAKKSR